MATAQRTNSGPAAQTQSRVMDAAKLLDQMLDSFSGSEQAKLVEDSLQARIEKIRDLLPAHLKEHAERFVKRAMLTFNSKAELRKVTPASFIKSVLQAAECGLAIDDKLGYAVPRNNKKKDGNKEWWEYEATFQPSYKGVIAVAKRTGQILDIYGDIICENDHWHHKRKGGRDEFEHERPQLGQSRGKTIGAYMKLVLPNGLWRVEVMDIHELNAIKARSMAQNKGGFSPWKSDEAEMQKKTVVHRTLKTYCDDPGLIVALQALEDADLDEVGTSHHAPPPSKVGRSTINDRLAPQPHVGSSWPQVDDDQFAGTQSHHDAPEGVDDAPADEGTQETPAATECSQEAFLTFESRIAETDTPLGLTQIAAEIKAVTMSANQRKTLDGMVAQRKKELK